MKKQLKAGKAQKFPRVATALKFTLVPPLLSLAFVGCGNMAEVKEVKKGENAAPIAEGVAPSITLGKAKVEQKEVLNAIRDMELVSSSSLVFNFLKSDVPVEDKYNVVNAFVFKYAETESDFTYGTGNPALDELLTHAASTFSTDFSMSISDLKKKEPERLSLMQSLAYGVAKSGHAGFRAALSMVANMDAARDNFNFPGLSTRDISLSGPFANMVCISMVKSGKLDVAKAIEDITKALKTEGISAPTKSALLNLVKIVDPLAFAELIKDPALSIETKNQARAAANSVLKSTRIPQETKDELKKRME